MSRWRLRAGAREIRAAYALEILARNMAVVSSAVETTRSSPAARARARRAAASLPRGQLVRVPLYPATRRKCRIGRSLLVAFRRVRPAGRPLAFCRGHLVGAAPYSTGGPLKRRKSALSLKKKPIKKAPSCMNISKPVVALMANGSYHAPALAENRRARKIGAICADRQQYSRPPAEMPKSLIIPMKRRHQSCVYHLVNREKQAACCAASRLFVPVCVRASMKYALDRTCAHDYPRHSWRPLFGSS